MQDLQNSSLSCQFVTAKDSVKSAPSCHILYKEGENLQKVPQIFDFTTENPPFPRGILNYWPRFPSLWQGALHIISRVDKLYLLLIILCVGLPGLRTLDQSHVGRNAVCKGEEYMTPVYDLCNPSIGRALKSKAGSNAGSRQIPGVETRCASVIHARLALEHADFFQIIFFVPHSPIPRDFQNVKIYFGSSCKRSSLDVSIHKPSRQISASLL